VLRTIARLAFGAAAGATAFSGQVYGTVLLLLFFLLMHRGDRRELLLRTRAGLLVCVAAGAAVVGAGVVRLGLAGGAKAALSFPYPSGVWIGTMFPGVYVFFLGAVAWLALRRPREEDDFLRACVYAVLTPLLLVGIKMKYAPVRYLISGHAFLLLVAAGAMVVAARRLLRGREALAAGACCLLVASGVLGGHGLPQAWRLVNLDYGDAVDEMTFTVDFYPDHETPGRYVREHLRPGDRVAAVDNLATYWYAGRCDYWIRDYDERLNFLHRHDDGEIRDIYVGALGVPDTMLGDLVPRPGSRLWVVTSGELGTQTKDELSAAQFAWLERVERENTPAYVGLDKATKVYLLEAPR
jgi:hypothetical protein